MRAMTSPSQIHIRPAVAGDLVAVMAVHDHHQQRQPSLVTSRHHATWQQMLDQPGLTPYIAEIEDAVVGTATLIVVPNLTYDQAPTAFIESVVVDPAHRRRGIATTMLTTMLADAQALGCCKVQLLAHKRHAFDGAHALYEKLGFSAEAEGFRRYFTPAHPQGDRGAGITAPCEVPSN